MYAGGKAARDMLLKVIAVEEPDVRALNYDPGIVGTEMNSYIRANFAVQSIRDFLNDVEKQGKLQTPEQTAERLTKILEEDSYQSGVHMDYKGVVH